MKISLSSLLALSCLTLGLTLLPGAAGAVSSYYSSSCAGCHGATPTTCNGCHEHGAGSVSGSLSKTNFTPGEIMAVTVTAGSRTGWWRAAVLDASNAVMGSTSVASGLSATVSVPAPTTAGAYGWKVAWYGNERSSGTPAAATWVADAGNSGHGYKTASLASFTVSAGTTSAPSAALAPASLAFGSVAVGQSATLTAALSNAGTGALSVSAVTACSGTTPTFALSPSAAFQLGAGGSQVLTATFTPSAAGAASGCFDLTTNDAANPTLRLTVAGTGTSGTTPTAPVAALTPAALAFGAVTVGQSATLTAAVSNTGTAALAVTAVTTCAGASADFAISPATAFQVVTGGSRQLTVTFTPAAAGAVSGCFDLATDDPASPTLQLTVAGTGQAATTPPATTCTSCHAIPPASGRHALHLREQVSCARCHGAGYSATTVAAKVHQNGKVNLRSSTGWSVRSRSCANSCHDQERWGTPTASGGGRDDDDFVVTAEEEAGGGCSSAGGSTTVLALLGLAALATLRRRRA